MIGLLTLITAPSVEPLTVAEAKTHLRVRHDDEDTLISSLILSARQRVEEVGGLALTTQTWELALDAFPNGTILLPRSPLQSVTSITYTDTNGDSQTVSSDDYTVDTRSRPGLVHLAFGQTWPATRDIPNAVVVRYVAGFGDDATDVPAPVRQALLLELGTLYAHREDVVTGTVVTPLHATRRLLAPYRIYHA